MQITKETVRLCYELLLDREPSDKEIGYFYDYSLAVGWESRQLVSEITKSFEFRHNHGTQQLSFFDDLGQVEYRGLSFLLPKNDFSTVALRDPRGYEPYVSNHLFANLRPGETLLDIGANLGLFALPAAKIVGEAGSVIAFEALPDNARLLARNAVRNSITNVSINPVALGDYNGSTTSERAPTSDRILNAPGSALSEDVDVMAVVRLDDFLSNNKKIDVLKIDVEGYEYRVFSGAKRVVSTFMPRIYMEYNTKFQMNGSAVPGSTLLLMLSNMGYGFTILHRDANPERIVGDDANQVVAAIDATVCRAEAIGVSHIDLFLDPQRS